LTSVEVELSKLSLDKENSVLAEMERIGAEHHQQTASHCDQLSRTLQQDVAHVTDITEQCHRDSITQMKSASDQLLQQVLGSIETMSVILPIQYLRCCTDSQ